MKILILSLILLTSFTTQAKTPVSVIQFVNRSAEGNGDDSSCHYYWHFRDLGASFRELLVDQLRRAKDVQVLEREVIKDIYNDEHNLINAENTKKLAKGKFKRARYTVAGVVSEFEWCEGGGGFGANIGRFVGLDDLGVNAKTSRAHVKVDVRLIDTETGEIIHTAVGEGKSSSTKFGLSGVQKGASMSGNLFKNSPLGEAIRKAISQAADDIINEIPRG